MLDSLLSFNSKYKEKRKYPFTLLVIRSFYLNHLGREKS